MRQFLIDRARRRNAGKRGGGIRELSLDRALNFAEARSADLLALDEALTPLRALDERRSRIVEMRFFADLSDAEIAEALGVSPNGRLQFIRSGIIASGNANSGRPPARGTGRGLGLPRIARHQYLGHTSGR